MLYSTVLVAVSALAGFASAQNSTFDTPIPCCQVPVNTVPQGQRSDWCAANQNTCVDICGGQGNIASNGNNCDDSTLNFTCRCSNGTNIDNSIMKNYEQTVPGQMCRFWFGACINATGTNAAQQFQCRQAANSQCGNLTTRASGGASSSASAGSTASRTSGSGSASNTAGSTAAASSGAANALAQFGTPVLAGGLLALFGIAL